jgi:hypothetical protein
MLLLHLQKYSQNTHDPKDPKKIKQKEERRKKVIDRKAADYGGLKPMIKKTCLSISS